MIVEKKEKQIEELKMNSIIHGRFLMKLTAVLQIASDKRKSYQRVIEGNIYAQD